MREREKPWSYYPEDEGSGTEPELDPNFLREYWQFRIDQKDDPRQVRVDGKVYWLGPDYASTPKQHKGFAGQEFRLRFFDGREVTTHDLWLNGEIPKEYREELPDNAVFLDREGREVDFWGHRKDGVDERAKESKESIEKWLAGVERRREELKRQPWVPKWQWKKQRGIP